MDVKSLAKSKRSHTRHHQPRKPKSTSSSTSTSTNSPSLPSNWNRYEEEDELEAKLVGSGSNDPNRKFHSSLKVASDDVVEPKSKGADFEELIAQAKESNSRYLPSFDDTLSDSYRGSGPMLVVRGESILSWDAGDNFLGDDEGTDSQEVPSLSLDLKAIAEQLEKVDLAKRLFIEADLLPPELRAPDAHEHNNHEPFQSKRQKNMPIAETFENLLSLYLAAEDEAESKKDEVKTGDMPSSIVPNCCEQILATTTEVTDHKFNDIQFLDTKETPLVSHTTERDPKSSSGFQPQAVETELDMLLNSFGETKLLDSPGPLKPHRTPVVSSKGSSNTHAVSSVGPSINAFNSNLDDALDDLLEETSKPNHKDGVLQSKEIQITSFDHPSSTHPTSKTMEDFDSWFDTL